MSNANNSTVAVVLCVERLDAVSIAILTAINSLCAPVTLAGNLLVLVAVYHTASLRTISNYFICSMAVVDLSVGIIMNPVVAVKSSLNILGNSHAISVATEALALQTIPATILNLCAMTIDRYVAITKPFRYGELMNEKTCTIIICTVWVLTFVPFSARFLVVNPLHLPWLWSATVVFCFVLPMLCISYCYFHIMRAVRSQNLKISAQTSVLASSGKVNQSAGKNWIGAARNKKAAWTLLAIIGVCVVFWVPGTLIAVIQLFQNDNCKKQQMNALIRGSTPGDTGTSALLSRRFCAAKCISH